MVVPLAVSLAQRQNMRYGNVYVAENMVEMAQSKLAATASRTQNRSPMRSIPRDPERFRDGSVYRGRFVSLAFRWRGVFVMNNMVTRLLARTLAPALIEPKRDADIYIGGREDTYMRRWWLIPRNNWMNIYLHNMLRDDDDRAHHDHPWWSLSLMLRGSISEIDTEGQRDMVAGSVRLRAPEYAHRLVNPIGAWTLFITGPWKRSWGFHCPRGWVHWKKFTGGPNGETIGEGCGEYESLVDVPSGGRQSHFAQPDIEAADRDARLASPASTGGRE